jgi:AmiR/NasT family two-component response regulator
VPHGAAPDSRDVIGQAKGILMERHRITPAAAFAVLVQASQTTRTVEFAMNCS